MMKKAIMGMKAVRIHDFGSFEKLEYEDAPIPEIQEGEVLVHVHAASVNPIDFKIARGSMQHIYPIERPWIPGGDFSGIVKKIGSAVSHLKIGDAVYGNCYKGGAYAEYTVTKASMIALKPQRLSHIEAASVPLAAQTAWQALFDHGRLQSGQTILIHAAAGGVGSFAVQFAHWKGAKVIATASEQNEGYLKELGADVIINYKKRTFESEVKDLDLVFDLVGGDTQRRSFSVLKPHGILVSAVEPPSPEEAAQFHIEAKAMRMAPSAQLLAEIGDLIEKGVIRTVVSKTYPLAQAQDAWVDILSAHTRGKIVLIISSLAA